MTEIQSYRVIDKRSGYEIRSYPAHFLVSVWVDGDMRSSGIVALVSCLDISLVQTRRTSVFQ